jgi:hypothetical protein
MLNFLRLGTCIGVRNYRFFMLYIFTLMLWSIFTLAVCVMDIINLLHGNHVSTSLNQLKTVNLLKGITYIECITVVFDRMCAQLLSTR